MAYTRFGRTEPIGDTRFSNINFDQSTPTYQAPTQATTQAVPTAMQQPVSSAPLQQVPGGVQIQGGGLQGLPSIGKDWISWQNAEAPVWESYGGDGGGQYQTYAGREAGYGFTGTGSNQDFLSSPFYQNTNNYEWSFDPTTGAPSVRIKSGDKTGTTVKYVQDASGNWVPDYSQQANAKWDTNKLHEGLVGALSPIAIGLGGYALASAAGVAGAGAAGGASGATGGLTAAEAAALSSEAAGGITGIGAGGTTAAEAAAAAGLPVGMTEGAGAASGLVELGGGGAGYTGSVAPVGGATSTTALPSSSIFGGMDFTELVTKYGKDAAGLIQQFAQSSGGQAGQNGQGGGILDLLKAYYDSQQNKDLSGNLKAMYSDALGRQQPYLQQLLASYQDPDSFYKSNQWKGLESVYQNQIDRKAASTGRMANPTDREVLLQAHAMKGLEDYRTGLRGSISALDPAKYADPYAKGLMAEAFANTPIGAALGRNGIKSVEDLVGQISSGVTSAGKIWDIFKEFFGETP